MPVVRFGESFELDPEAYLLRRSGHALRLERIPMEILLLFLEHRGQLVTREQIVERVWGKGTHLDADNSINGAIRKIRQILKDDPEHPQFIQTVTGRGYRFVAPLRDADTTPAPPGPAPAPSGGGLRRLWIAGGVGVLAVGLVALALGPLRSKGVASEQRVMVAVLPFDNLTGDVHQEYFSDGLTEEMITQLGERDPEHLGVIARTSVMHYKSDRPSIDRIARELSVQYVLEGSVRRGATDVRVTAQLIRVSDQTQVWAQQYDRRPADLLTLQGEIAQAIASEIPTRLGGGRRPPVTVPSDSTPATHSFEAYDLYLQGAYVLNKRAVPELEKAIRFFDKAVATDSTYARAYAGLADAYVLLAGYSAAPPRDMLAKARTAVQRALALDSSLAEAHTAFALIIQNEDLDWATSEREFRRAIELNPSYATAHHWYAEHLMWLGRFDEALRESDLASRLDPLSLIIATDNGAILYYARQYDRAILKWRAVLQVEPDFPRAHMIEAAYMQKRMFAEAEADLESHRNIDNPWYWSARAALDAQAGRTDEARNAMSQLWRTSRRQPLAAAYIAAVYASLGDKDSTMLWLERAYAEHPSEIIALKVDPTYDLVRGDPRFERLLERMGLAT